MALIAVELTAEFETGVEIKDKRTMLSTRKPLKSLKLFENCAFFEPCKAPKLHITVNLTLYIFIQMYVFCI